jgi:hypothetical protein
MKKHINPFNLFIIPVFLLAPFLGRAADGDNVQKKKNISKSYTVGSDEKLSIENSFGDVAISTWDKNEIQVNIEIVVNAPTDEKAQRMMDEIQVSDKRGGNEISFKTEIGNMGNGKKNWSKDGDQRRFYIDYKVVMPAGNPLNVENSFGKINIGNFTGPVTLVSKFGELSTGRLVNPKTLHVEFGKADIGPVTNPEVIFKFNSRSSIKSVSGDAKIHTEFCNNVEFAVDPGIRDLSVAESYSNIRMNIPENLSASFKVHTNFGSFKNNSYINISEERDEDTMGPRFDRDYSGSSGSGTARIKIRSSFGKIRIANAGDTSVDPEDNDNNNDNHSGQQDKDNTNVNL